MGLLSSRGLVLYGNGVPQLTTSLLIVVTGSGIGRDCGLAYAAAGVIGVVFADINLTSAQLASEDSKVFATNASYRTIALTVDVTSEKSMNAMVEKAVGEFGRIDYAVSSAGVRSMLHSLISKNRD